MKVTGNDGFNRSKADIRYHRSPGQLKSFCTLHSGHLSLAFHYPTVSLVVIALTIGFLPALLIAWAYELTPEGLKRASDVDRSVPGTPSFGRKLDFMIIAVLVLAVTLLIADRYFSEPEHANSHATGKSIAVLPFVNMSSDQEQEYFSDGITEEILNSLASVKELKVAGRTSSFAFKGQNEDLRRIGDTLGLPPRDPYTEFWQ